MSEFKCETHDVLVIIKEEEKNKEIYVLRHGVSQCYLFTEKEPIEGEHGDCKIIKLKE